MRLDVDLIMSITIMPNRDMSNPKHNYKQLSLPDNKSRNTSYICFNVESTIVLHLHCGRRSMLVGICFKGRINLVLTLITFIYFWRRLIIDLKL